MRDPMPTLNDVKHLLRKQQRRKNIIPEYAVLTKTYNKKITELRNVKKLAKTQEAQEAIQQQIVELLRRKDREEKIVFQELLEKLEDYIRKQPDKVRLKKHRNPKRRITSLNKSNSVQMLFDQYCSIRIAKAFKVNPKGRDHCIRVLLNALAISAGPKKAQRGIIRFDIHQFFDSIPHVEVMQKLERHAGIPEYICKHTRAVLSSYQRIYNIDRGLPQGVPSSSVLAEIYLESLDAAIRNDARVALYLRYVDDVIIIGEPDQIHQIQHTIQQSLSKRQLTASTAKPMTILAHPSAQSTQFEYLGYEFNFSAEDSQLASIDINETKRDRLLNASKRLGQYANQDHCWADPKTVNFFFHLSDYLFQTHKSNDENDSPRIITGLGYNARFVRGNRKTLRNLTTVIRECEKYLRSLQSKINAHGSGLPTCPCCNKLVYRGSEFTNYRKRYLDIQSILNSPAMPHASDADRSKIKDYLWS